MRTRWNAPEIEPLEQVRDRLAQRMVIAAWMLAVPLTAYHQSRAPELATTTAGLSLLVGLTFCGLLIRQGHGRVARRLLVAAMLLGLASRAFFLGGVNSVDFTVVAFVPLLAAVLVSGRTAVVSAVVGVALGAGLQYVELKGWLPAPRRALDSANALPLLLGLFALGAFVGAHLATGLSAAFARGHAHAATLRRNEDRYAQAASGANIGVWEWDLRTGELWLAPGVQQILGAEAVERVVEPAAWRELTHPDDRERARAAAQPALEGDEEVFAVEYRVRHARGDFLWVLSRGRLITEGGARRLVGSFSDVDERHTMQAALEHRALHDALTGLPNRTLLLDRLQQTLHRAGRTSTPGWALLYLDLDRFKDVNDSLGHAAGDALLEGVASRLRGSLRLSDTAARIGGDEFVLLLDGVEDAVGVARRLVDVLEAPMLLGGSEVRVRSSVGVVLAAPGYTDPEEVLRDADAAMYAAKRDPGTRVEVFRPQLRRATSQLIELDGRLKRALEKREFVPWFQPIVDLETRRVTGWESLVRWEQPDGSILMPDTFLPRAEEIGLLADIDRALVIEACMQVADWTVIGRPQTLSVNLSARQFGRADLVEWLAAVLRRSGLDAARLQIEITEQLLIEDRGSVRQRMQDLRSLGVRLAIDDFGTGYSSLGYLQQFPIDVLKIDRRFVQEGEGKVPGPICRAIVSMAQALGLDLVAEGVETDAQRDALLGLGVVRGQGWLFGRAEGTRRPGLLVG